MALFDILVNIAASTASFESGMDRAAKKLEEFGEIAKSAFELAGIGAGLDALKEGISSATDTGEQLVLMAQRMGTTVESLSQLQYAAKATNVPFEVLASAIDTLSKNLVTSSEGTGKASAALADLNINAEYLSKLPLDAQLSIIADHIKNLPTATQQTAAALRVFGGAGADLLPILRQGSDGIDELREKADDLGVTMSGQTAESLQKAADQMTELKTVSKSLWDEIVADSAPAITALERVATNVLGGLKKSLLGFDTPKEELDSLTSRAKVLQDQIKQLTNDQASGNEGFLSAILGGDSGQIATAEQELDEVQKKIVAVRATFENTLSEVQVSAHKIGAGSIPPLDLLNFSGNDHMLADFYAKKQKLGENDDRRQANEWADELFNAQFVYDRETQLAEEYYATNTQSDAEYVAASIKRSEDYSNQQDEIAAKFLSPIAVSAKQIGKVAKTTYDGMETYARTAASSIQEEFADALVNPTISGFKGMLVAWAQTLEKMAAQAAASTVFKSLFGDTGPGGNNNGLAGLLAGGLGLGSLFGSGISAGASASLGTSASLGIDSAFGDLFGFANGGSFDVGGSGGTDSQLVAFKATPGENVQVGGGGGGNVQVNNYVTVSGQQAVTQEQVLSAMKQTSDATVARIQDMKRRRKL